MTNIKNPHGPQRQAETQKAQTTLPQLQWAGPSDKLLAKLRTDYELDNIITASAPEFEQFIQLRDWVHSRFAHHSSNFPAKFDTLHILDQVAQGQRYRCVEYSFILADVYRAMGWPARLVRLEGEGGAHAMSEVYAYAFDKWVLMDGQHAAHVLRNGVPINVYELQQAVWAQQEVGLQAQHADPTLDYIGWNRGYLRYLMYPQDMSYGQQLSTLLVLAPAQDPGPTEKPEYLEIQDTDYIVIHDPQLIYAKAILPAKQTR